MIVECLRSPCPNLALYILPNTGEVWTAWAGDSRAVLGVWRADENNVEARRDSRIGGPKPDQATPWPNSEERGERPPPLGGLIATTGSLERSSHEEGAGRWHAVELSSDHKPDRPDERRRIILSGGRVSRSNSGLALSLCGHLKAVH